MSKEAKKADKSKKSGKKGEKSKAQQSAGEPRSAGGRLARSKPLAQGLRRIGHLDLAGGGQVYIEGHHAFIGHMKPPHGTTVVDISDPSQPMVVAELMLEDNRTHTHKVRVVGDLMITNVEQNERNAFRAAGDLSQTGADLEAELGRPPDDAELGAAVGLRPDQIRLCRDFAAHPYEDGGFKIWDVSRRQQPRLITHVRTHGVGVHRFDMDQRYAYISTEMQGYVGNILVIYDLWDPARPEEVGRWWMPGQHVAGGETPSWPGVRHRLHHALRQGDVLWAAVWYAGVRMIDISDIGQPRTIGGYNHHPPFPAPTHTFLKVPFALGGREIAIVADEEQTHQPGQLHAGLWLMDVTNPNEINALSMYHLSERDSPFVGHGRFGLHQFQEHLEDTHVYCAWFAGGVRAIDIKDPTQPLETGYFIPEPIGGEKAPQTNDVDVDDRGLVAIIDRIRGFDILEPTGA